MKALLRLYPRSWRKRYGGEMDALVEELPSEIGVALDLMIGAAVAYASVVRSNRLLSTAAAYLHGVCVAVLIQAIAFVTLVLVSQQSQRSTTVEIGPFQLATVEQPGLLGLAELNSLFSSEIARTLVPSLPGVIVLMVLVATLVLVLAGPRWVRRSVR